MVKKSIGREAGEAPLAKRWARARRYGARPLLSSPLVGQVRYGELRLLPHKLWLFISLMEKYRLHLRINMAKNMLINENLSVKEVAFKLGYGDIYSFHKQFKQIEGVTPKAYIAHQK